MYTSRDTVKPEKIKRLQKQKFSGSQVSRQVSCQVGEPQERGRAASWPESKDRESAMPLRQHGLRAHDFQHAFKLAELLRKNRAESIIPGQIDRRPRGVEAEYAVGIQQKCKLAQQAEFRSTTVSYVSAPSGTDCSNTTITPRFLK
jgi:hypothetical protein